MRSRLLRFVNTLSHSIGTQIPRVNFAIPALLAGTAASAYVFKSYKDDFKINMELTTHREMREYRDALRHAFQSDNSDNHDAIVTFNALLKAISSNQIDIAEEMLNDLVAHDATITEETRDGLIVYTANHSKVEILELLQKVFTEEDVLRNRHARDLLLLSPEERKIVTHISEEFYQSPGEIRHDGMFEFVKAKQKNLLQLHLQYRAYQPVYNCFDLAEDIAESYRQVKSINEITDEMETKFRRTIVLDLAEHDTYEQVTAEYFRRLVQDAKNEKKPVVGTFVMTGAHFTLGQIMVVHYKPDQSHATVVFIDPKGSYSSILTNDYTFIASVPHHVFDKVDVYISEEKNQLAGMGCSLFVADQYEIVMTLDQIMKWNNQYPFAGNENVIFDYAKHAKTSEHIYGVDFDGSDGTFGTFKSLAKFSLFTLPAALIVGKQSLDGVGVKDDAPETFVKEANGRYSSVVGADSTMDFPGVMGYYRAKENSSWQRKIEFDRPADISGRKTVDETVKSTIENAEHKGHIKPRNKRNDNKAYEFGLFMSKNADSILESHTTSAKSSSHESEGPASVVDYNLDDALARDLSSLIHSKH